MPQTATIHDILSSTFGYNTFRDRQEDIINHVIEGKDALVVMPTGGGKSLCYQIPALAQDGVALVISPLIALMDDQVSALRQLGVEAAALHSNLRGDEAGQIYDKLRNEELKLLYVSPEKALTHDFQLLLSSITVSIIAIDEAHCVSVWGNDFRPDYVRLAFLRDKFPDVPIIALTATADAVTRDDIVKQLRLKTPKKFVSSFERANINITVAPGTKRIQRIIDFISTRPETSGIVYCLSRKATEKIASRLAMMGLTAEPYHAGMDAEHRRRVQSRFQNDEISIVCATIAFGMGIDKPNIRWIIHHNMPKNLEGYYQEIGRAGRDGEPAEAMLLHSWGDYMTLQKFIDEGDATEQFNQVQRAKLERMWNYASASSCRTNVVLSYFGEFKEEGCGHCDNCLNPPEMFDGTRYAQMALSGVARTNQSIGLWTLVDILRGSGKQDVLARGFHNIKTYGVGRDIPGLEWQHYITQMLNCGILMIDFSDHSKLKLTPLSKAVLFEGQQVMLSRKPETSSRKEKKREKVIEESKPLDQSLYASLKSWRASHAKKLKIPAYAILHDKALKQISSTLPNDDESLLAIDGIGQVKLEKYGEAIIGMVNEFR